MIHHYRCADFSIRSELPLSAAMAASPCETVDVEVTCGPLPKEQSLLGEYGGDGLWMRASDSAVALRANGIARIRVESGCRVTVDAWADADPAAVQAVLGGAAWAALLSQRGFLVLHGGCVCWDGEGIALLGPSGAGKSSLVNYLHSQGASALSDELVAVKAGPDGRMYAWPVFRAISLCADAVQRQGLFGKLDRAARAGTDKWQVATTPDDAAPIALTAIVSLRAVEGDFAARLVGDGARMAILLRNSYLRPLLADAGLLAAHFQQCVRLLGQTRVVALQRPAHCEEADLVRHLASQIPALRGEAGR